MNYRHGIALGLSLLMAANLCAPAFAAEETEKDALEAAATVLREAESESAAPQPGDTVEIASVEEFQAFADFVNASESHGADITWRLAADIDLGTHTPVPVFCGTLDGGGHTITANATVDGDAGLFAVLRGAKVENLTLIVTATSSSGASGALAARAEDTEISKCEAAGGSVSGADYVGGLVGRAENCTLADCAGGVPVSGSYDVGGLVGAAAKTTVEWSHCTASVNGRSGGIGGLVGRLESGTVAYSYFGENAAVHGTAVQAIGGLVGGAEGAVTVHDCYSRGSVSGGGLNIAGGIVGANLGLASRLDISNCYMTGSVSSGAAICGFSLRGTVMDCVYLGREMHGWFGSPLEEAAIKLGDWIAAQQKQFWTLSEREFPTLSRQTQDTEAAPTITVEVSDKVYDGKPADVKVTVSGTDSTEVTYTYRQIIDEETAVELPAAPVSVGSYSVQVSIPGASVAAPFSIRGRTMRLTEGTFLIGEAKAYQMTTESLDGEYTVSLPKDCRETGFRIALADETGTQFTLSDPTVYENGVSVYLDGDTTYYIIPASKDEVEAK